MFKPKKNPRLLCRGFLESCYFYSEAYAVLGKALKAISTTSTKSPKIMLIARLLKRVNKVSPEIESRECPSVNRLMYNLKNACQIALEIFFGRGLGWASLSTRASRQEFGHEDTRRNTKAQQVFF